MKKTIVITGASFGIGEAISLHLAKKGYKLALLARTREKLQQLKEELPQVEIYPCDITKAEDIQQVSQQILQDFEHVDGLVNNAGVILLKPVEQITLEEWKTVIDTNLTGQFLVTKAFLPYFYRQKHGHVIFVASILSSIKYIVELNGAYAASKFGIVGFAETLQKEAKKHNVLVSLLFPGPVDTPGYRKAIDPALRLSQPLSPQIIAEAVEFMIEHPYTTRLEISPPI